MTEPKVMPQDADEWRSALMSIHLSRSLLEQWDLAGMLDLSIRQDSIGSMLNPTLWRDKHKAAEIDRAVIEAALTFIRKFPKPPQEKTT